MPPAKKTPTSSLSVIELLVKRALYRTLAGIRKTRSGGVSPETSPTHSSPATRLPLEVVETIIAYLAYDKRSLRACTLTCYSWYIVAVPYLYRTLTVSTDRWDRSKSRWPNPILRMHRLGLLPLVREFRVHGDNSPTREFSPKLLNCCILRQFSALSNVQVLEIEYLEIPKLIPRIRRYFRNFLPTVRSLILRKPRGTPRQIVYFVGIFQHLQDLELLYCAPGPWEGREGPADDPTLIPAFVPPLRGWLKMACVRVVGLLKAMIDLFGELRFRYMSLYEVDRVRLLLEACAETLEVVELDPTDPNAKHSLRDFDLSRNKSLRTLQVPKNFISHISCNGSRDAASRFLGHVLSTITSSVFFKVIVLYGTRHFSGIELPYSSRAFFGGLSQVERADAIARHRMVFEAFRKMHEVRRDFQLVLCVRIWGSVGEEPVRIVEEAVAEEKAKKGFSNLLSDPLVDYSPKWSHP